MSALRAATLGVLFTAGLLLSSCGGGRLGTAPTPEPAERLAEGDHDILLLHDGEMRRYLVHIPPRASRQPAPVVLAFHGGGGNPDQFKAEAGLDEVSDREGFVVVYPAGFGNRRRLLTWNAGTNCCGQSLDLDIDDVGFVRDVVSDLATRYPIDNDRIYSTGHSNGAGMTYRLAAEAGDLIAAAVPVAGASMGIAKQSARPIPLLHIHSVDDPRALYQGGLGPPFPGTNRRVDHVSVEEELQFWRELNGCGVEVEILERREDLDNEQNGELMRWDCPATSPVLHWRLHGVGHPWPGAGGFSAERIVGPGTQMVSAAEEVWSFVRDYRR